MIIAGEASGDLHASGLIEGIRRRDPEAEFRFFGGDMMARAARCRPVLHYEEMNVMGFSEVLRSLPRIARHLRLARRTLAEFRPDTLILVDYPGFNLRMARYARKLGVRVDWFISPKVWAWKEWRVRSLRRYVSGLYCILPFEVEFFARHGMKVEYVGNPTVGEMEQVMSRIPPFKHFCQRQGIDDTRPVIALLPGSRRGEIRNNLPLMIEAAKRFPDYQYVVAAAPAISEKFYRQTAQDPGLQLVFGSSQVLAKYSRAALVTSGTATLETALMGAPQVVCYRANGSRLSYAIMERLLKVRHVSLPNLIVDNTIIPELLLHQCTVDNIVRELGQLVVNSPARERQMAGYRTMRRKLGTSDAADRTAELIVNALKPG